MQEEHQWERVVAKGVDYEKPEHTFIDKVLYKVFTFLVGAAFGYWWAIVSYGINPFK